MKITVAIPYYDNEFFLKKAILSVLAQTVKSWKLVISLDNELSIKMNDFIHSLNDPRIILIRNAKKGIAENWNNCVDNVTSDFIVILHSDDELMPTYLEFMYNQIDRDSGACLYFCRANIIDDNSQDNFSFIDFVKRLISPKPVSFKVSGDLGLSSLLKGCYIFCPTICYRMSVLKEYKFSSQWNMVLDLELYSRLLFDGKYFIGTNNSYYNYRRHENNQTVKLTKDFGRFDEEIMLYNNINESALALNWVNTVKTTTNKYIIKLHLIYLTLKSMISMNYKQTKRFVSYLKNNI